MFKPTVGLVVWLYGARKGQVHDIRAPLCAFVVHVWGDRCVNLAYFDSNGQPHAETSVGLLQDDDARPEAGAFATWRPFEIERAEAQAATA